MKNKPWANVGDVVVCVSSSSIDEFQAGEEFDVLSIDEGLPNFKNRSDWISPFSGYRKIERFYSFEVKK